jgi:hypothetical protein
MYGAPVRLTEQHGAVELRAGGRLMCAAYSMRGCALQMLLKLLEGSTNAALNLDEPSKTERDGAASL